MRKLRFVGICIVITGMIGVGIMDKAVPMILVLGFGVGILVGEIVGDKWIK